MSITIPRGKIGVTKLTLPASEQTILLNPNEKDFHKYTYLHPTAYIKSNLNERRRCLIEFSMDRVDGGDPVIIRYPIALDGSGAFIDPYGDITFTVPIYRNDLYIKPKHRMHDHSIFGTRTLSARIIIDDNYFIPDLPFEHDVEPATCKITVAETEPRVARCKQHDGALGDWYCSGDIKYTCEVVNEWGDAGWVHELDSPDCMGDPPLAAFSYEISGDTAPFIVRFSDKSTNGPTEWLWDFGDGNTSTERNPDNIYERDGTYTVILATSNDAGSDSARWDIELISDDIDDDPPIPDGPPDPVRPTADFISSGNEGTAPFTIQFQDTSDGNPTSWLWDFGDWSDSTEQHPSHTFTKGGEYRVTLTASNSMGESEAYMDITVLRTCSEPTGTHGTTRCIESDLMTCIDGTWEMTEENAVQCSEHEPSTKPVASFVSSREPIGDAPLTITFTDTSTGNPTAWQWNFGDGLSSNDRNPTHTFLDPGIYTTTLTVSNENGSSSVKMRIDVEQDHGQGPGFSLPDIDLPAALDGWIIPIAIVGVGGLLILSRRKKRTRALRQQPYPIQYIPPPPYPLHYPPQGT